MELEACILELKNISARLEARKWTPNMSRAIGHITEAIKSLELEISSIESWSKGQNQNLDKEKEF